MRNIILTGFMGTGKTTVGRMLEERLKMRFVDTDSVIEDMAGTSINEIFSIKGEAHFRELETKAIEMVTKRDNQIIATGGGAIINDDNLRMLKSSGKVISLTASADTIFNRVSSTDERPLLNNTDMRTEIERLLESRIEYYEKADFMINTDDMLPAEVADSVEDYIVSSVAALHLDLGARSYDIKIGSGSLSTIGKELNALGFSERAVVITNGAINDIYGGAVIRSLQDANIDVETIIVEEGEKSKSLSVVNEIITKMLELKCERNTPLIALGGGVIGDLTGFVASIYLRGVPFIQIPTTLLAQVDSSVGGKTGVNHQLGKNLIGAFYQPKLVLIDTDVLNSLPHDEFLNGISEIIKYGVIRDAELFDYLIDNADAILKRDAASVSHLIHIIRESCAIKADVVSEDERESGVRAILNFGHTLGHALEANASYKGIKHGRAVAIGMIFAAKLAVSMDLCEQSVHDRIKSIINLYGIDINIDIDDAEQIISTMKLDKKVRKGSIKFVLPREIGIINYGINVSESDLMAIL